MTNNSGDLRDEREDYNLSELTRKGLADNPLSIFKDWMDAARRADIIDATAMTLATVGANGAPSARIVLLKQFSEAGFYWYTNYESRKGRELSSNPNAALVFYWCELERQVRIEGKVSAASAADSDEYFYQRPIGSRFSAAASPQSQVIENQQWLTERTQEMQNNYDETSLVRPKNWGGYVLEPVVYEFWQGRPSRQHDRFRFTRRDSNDQNAKENNNWTIDRLAP